MRYGGYTVSGGGSVSGITASNVPTGNSLLTIQSGVVVNSLELHPACARFMKTVIDDGLTLNTASITAYNDLCLALEAEGWMDILDRLWIPYTISEAVARIDVINGKKARKIGSPTFTAFDSLEVTTSHGWVADCDMSALSGHYQVSLGRSIGAWRAGTPAAGIVMGCGAKNGLYSSYLWVAANGTDMAMRLDGHDESGGTGAGGATGLFIAAMNGMSPRGYAPDGSVVTMAGGQSLDDYINNPMGLGGHYTASGFAAATNKFRAFYIGGSPTDGQVTALITILSDFFTDIVAANP